MDISFIEMIHKHIFLVSNIYKKIWEKGYLTQRQPFSFIFNSYGSGEMGLYTIKTISINELFETEEVQN